MIIGIDLGTTNSLVAAWGADGPRLIPNALGEVLTPSCVSIDEDGTILVGRAARERLQSHPERTAAVFKRHMGSDHTIRLGKREFRPEELSALVLKSLKEDAEANLGMAITEAIVTVPAYFSEAQRKATHTAARLAGLRVERLLNEPTAAALAYGIHNREGESKFLVFDLGGGTFDVSILDLFEGVMEVRASSGDAFLGGEDFVQILVDHFFQERALPRKAGNEPGNMQRIMARVESLKKGLSLSPTASTNLLLDGVEYGLHMDEVTFETLAEPLLSRLSGPIERALRDAKMRADDLDAIILAGGASRMPIVQRLVTRLFGRPPSCELNPDEVIVMGAAVQAGLKMKDAALADMVMTDVAPYTLGIEISRDLGELVLHGHFDPVIERNTVTPASRVKRYSPIHDYQKELDLKVFQGEARLVKDNIQIGRLKIRLAGGTREESSVDVRFTYDVNGLLEVEATPAAGGETRRIIIQGNTGILTDQEIEARLKELSSLKIHPRDRMENRTVFARGESLYSLLSGRAREEFAGEMALFEQAIEAQDDRVIGPARKRIEARMNTIENELILSSGLIQ